MKKKYAFNVNKIMQNAFTVVNPILGIISVFLCVIKKKEMSVFAMAFGLSTAFIYFPIMYDTLTNFIISTSYNASNVSSYVSNYAILTSYLMKEYNINYMLIIFFYTYISLSIWFYIANKNIKKSEFKIIIFLVFIFSVNFREIMDLNRNFLAYCFFLFGMFNRKLVIKYMFFILAILIHSSAIVGVVCYFISFLITTKRRLAYLTFFSVLIAIVLPDLLEFLSNLHINYGGEFITRVLSYLTSSIWGVRSYTIEILGIKLVNLLPPLVLFFIVYQNFKYCKNDYRIKTALVVFILSILFFNYFVFYERFILLSTMLLLSFVPMVIKDKKIITLVLSTVVVKFIMINFFVYGYVFLDIKSQYSDLMPNNEAKIEFYKKPFYIPTLYLLNISDEGYSNKYISNNYNG